MRSSCLTSSRISREVALGEWHLRGGLRDEVCLGEENTAGTGRTCVSVELRPRVEGSRSARENIPRQSRHRRPERSWQASCCALTISPLSCSRLCIRHQPVCLNVTLWLHSFRGRLRWTGAVLEPDLPWITWEEVTKARTNRTSDWGSNGDQTVV